MGAPAFKSALQWTEETRHGEDKCEARFTKPRPECPNPEYWTSDDIEATEREVIEGVAGLVRLLQPDLLLETGSHRGFMTEAIGRSIERNGHGRLLSVEIDPTLHAEAKERCEGFPVDVVLGSSLDAPVPPRLDFAWFDSGPGDIRIQEFLRFYPAMHENTIVGFHDVGTHNGQLRVLILELMRHGMVIPVFLPTPRGVVICQVVPRG